MQYIAIQVWLKNVNITNNTLASEQMACINLVAFWSSFT